MDTGNGAPRLRLHNKLNDGKVEFAPIDASNVRMYVCGPTVYDLAHVGNARPIIVFDVLFRLLRELHGEGRVTYVRNITDVDDKINQRALERGIAIRELTESTVRDFHQDIAALGVLPPTVEPRATEHIDDMRAMIGTLVANGHAYVAEDHVLFHVPSMPDYGELSNRSVEEMKAGARVEVAPYKRSPLDFVLWKPSKPGEPGWESPAGIAALGRPGWHIECSAMAGRHLGQVFDIHGGGVDLAFPHHENEIAQSRCAHGTPVMANVWMHNGFLMVEGRKMAKSEGNFRTIREVVAEWPGEVVRLAMLMTHYRQPIDFKEALLEHAYATLVSWQEAVGAPTAAGDSPSPAFMAAMLDDLNTPAAIAELHRLAKLARSGGAEAAAAAGAFVAGIALLGLSGAFPHLGLAGDEAGAALARWRRRQPAEIDTEEVERLVAERNEARRARDWGKADRIRDDLAAKGVVLQDVKVGKGEEPRTTWSLWA